jgi:hypothetical protein
VIVAPAFTSVGVIPEINGCDADKDGVDGLDDFEQPYGRIATNSAKRDKKQLSVFCRVMVSSNKVHHKKELPFKKYNTIKKANYVHACLGWPRAV